MTHAELIRSSILQSRTALLQDRDMIDASNAALKESRRMIAEADAHLSLYETVVRPLAFACAMTITAGHSATVAPRSSQGPRFARGRLADLDKGDGL